jgi:hypothetical protein
MRWRHPQLAHTPHRPGRPAFHAYPDGAAEDAVAGADVAPVAPNIAELHGNPGERRQEREVVNASIEDRADTGNSWTTMQRKYRRQECVARYGK